MARLFKMDFSELCADFNATVPRGYVPTPTGRTLCVLDWKTGSRNDVFRAWLARNAFPFLSVGFERLWFSMNGETWSSVDFIPAGADRFEAFELR